MLPLDVLAHQRALVAHLLAPVDGEVAAAAVARSVKGVRPEVKSSGTRARAAFITPTSALATPTSTWTITACGRPVTSQ